MAINLSSDTSDTNSTVYLSGPQTVTTSEVEAKVGGSREVNRQTLSIYNDGSSTIYFGPTGVTSSTGEPLLKKQRVEIPVSDIGVYMITASGSSTVIIQELG